MTTTTSTTTVTTPTVFDTELRKTYISCLRSKDTCDLLKFNQNHRHLAPLDCSQLSKFYENITNLLYYFDLHTNTVQLDDPAWELPATHRSSQQCAVIKVNSKLSMADAIQNAWLTHLFCKDGIPASLHFFCTFPAPRCVFLVTKKPDGDLATYIKNTPNDERFRKALFFILQLAYAVDYLHNHLGVAHMDINARNVVISENRPLLVGFDKSKFASGPDRPADFEHFKCTVEDHYLEDLGKLTVRKFSVQFKDIGRVQTTLANNHQVALTSLGHESQLLASPYTSVEQIDDVFNLAASVETLYFADTNISISFDSATHTDVIQSQLDAVLDNGSVGYFTLRANSPMEVFSACCPDLSGLPPCAVASTSCESFGTMAPECLAIMPAFRDHLSAHNIRAPASCNNAFKADVFSLGLLFYFILTGSHLYPSMGNTLPPVLLNMWRSSSAHHFTLSFDKILSSSGHKIFDAGENPVAKQLRALLTGMLQIESFQRVSIKRVIHDLHAILASLSQNNSNHLTV